MRERERESTVRLKGERVKREREPSKRESTVRFERERESLVRLRERENCKRERAK